MNSVELDKELLKYKCYLHSIKGPNDNWTDCECDVFFVDIADNEFHINSSWYDDSFYEKVLAWAKAEKKRPVNFDVVKPLIEKYFIQNEESKYADTLLEITSVSSSRWKFRHLMRLLLNLAIELNLQGARDIKDQWCHVERKFLSPTADINGTWINRSRCGGF